MLLDLGTERLGQPSDDIERAIGQIVDLDHLRRLVRRFHAAQRCFLNRQLRMFLTREKVDVEFGSGHPAVVAACK